MPKFTEDEARVAIANALCWSDALRALGLRAAGGNHRTIKHWATHWGIDTSHFDPDAVRARALRREPVPLATLLVEHSTASRQNVKRRLLLEGLKQPVCELCGQGDRWRGGRMALVLDHINGIADDHRLENLRILCPNCAATLPTHCGKQNRRVRTCEQCAREFSPKRADQRFCSQRCAYKRDVGVAKPELRARLGPELHDHLRHVLRERTLAWAREAAGGAEPLQVGGADELEALLAHHDGPVLLVAPDVPGLGTHHVAAARDDLDDGVLLSSAPATDGRPFLVSLARSEPRLLALAGQPFEVLAGTAHELGGDLGMLRPERRLASVADARALRADPLAPPELRDLLETIT
jgi:hypothetical protein